MAETSHSGTTRHDVDVVVIGMGIAGEGVAGPLAEQGLEVVGIENGLVGGECPYWGCIPSKMAIRAALALQEARRVDGLAGTATVTPDWALVATRIRDEATDDWNDQVAVDRFVGKGGTFVRGQGRLDGPSRVVVGDRAYVARLGIVIATGTRPAIPPIPGLADVPYWTNHEVLEAKELPGSMIVLGGGAVGLELAQATSRFGVAVTVVEALEQLAPREETEAGTLLADVFAEEGIDVRVAARAVEVVGDAESVAVRLDDDSEITADRLLVAVGRTSNIDDLGLETIGLDPTSGVLETDLRGRAGEKLWGVGDVIGRGLFTHVAAFHAPIVRADIVGEDSYDFDASPVPRVTFTDPEIGSVGLTEAEAREAGIDVQVGLQQVPHSARGWLHKAGNEGFIKLIVDTDRDVIVGATSVGPAGGEVLGLLVLAIHAEVPVSTMRRMIYAYPTFHRGVEDALNSLT